MLRSISLIILFTIIICMNAHAEGCDESLADSVIVKKHHGRLPLKRKKADHYLWTEFSNREEILPLRNCFSQNWEEKYDVVSSEMVKQAEQENLNHTTLQSILDSIKPFPKHPFQPIGAYLSKRGKEEIWIVITKERVNTFTEENKNEEIILGRLRIQAFTCKEKKSIAYKTGKYTSQ